MPAKAPAKKTKSAQKPVRKTAVKAPQKVTWDEIQAGFKELQEIQKKTEESFKKIQETRLFF
jgi:hypothetical protein